MGNQIFWISSYPKSGNTLIRSILTALFFTDDGKFELEKLKNISQFEITSLVEKNKHLFDENYLKLGNTELFYKYIEKLQTKESLGFDQDFIFLKTHSGLFKIGENPFTSEENTRGIIYILRDPRDICISYSKHINLTINETIEFMINDYAIADWVESPSKGSLFNDQNRPKSLYSSWEKHVLSWTSIKWKCPIIILRFEDLIINKEAVINKIINFFEKNYSFKFENKNKKIKNIMASTEFLKLKEEEKQKGFKESTSHNSFFSTGKKNQWKSILNNEQTKKIEKKFSKVMRGFNYI
jgi:hypothetical protein